MKLDWKNIDEKEINTINRWLSISDKQNLCMTQKDWQQTAEDIGDCLKYMNNAEFKNIIGYINGKPIVALMFGIESIGVLNLYNIVVNPKFRNLGVAKNVINKLLNNSLNISKPYKKVIMSILPNNENMKNLLNGLEFNNKGFDGQYVVCEKPILKKQEKTI